jgi:hypothetical protein
VSRAWRARRGRAVRSAVLAVPRDFEQLVAWLAVRMDTDALRRLVQVDWDTVGRVCDRVVADELDPGRRDDLYDIGVDEISSKKHHNLPLTPCKVGA